MFGDPTFWVAVAFVVFIAATYKPMKKVVMSGLDSKIETIRNEVEDAARLREEAQSILAEFERKQAQASKHAEELLSAARKEAEQAKTAAEAELQKSLERQEKSAMQKIAQAEEKAIQEVRDMAVDLAMAAASKLIVERVAGDGGDALIDKAINEIPGKLH